MSIFRHSNTIRAAGFTLVEVMIALLIGLIGIVVMMQTFAVSEGFKRTATSGTDAQINGAVAFYMIEREVRHAGFGMNDLMKLGCPSVRVWNSVTGTGTDARFTTPFEINPAGIPAGDLNTDVLMVSYGTSDSFVVGIPADQNFPPPAAPTNPFFLYSNRDGFKNGDRFISVQPSPTGPSCVMHEATATAPASGNCGVPANPLTSLFHTAGNYKNARNGCSTVTATMNSATGIRDSAGVVVPIVKYGSGGQIFNLGAVTVKIYAIRNGNLTFCDWVLSNCTDPTVYTILVNDIVSLRAVYGKDLSAGGAVPGVGLGAVTSWDRTPLTGNVYLQTRVISAALELTARSNVKEKPTTGSVCNATPVATQPDRGRDWMYQSLAGAGVDLSTVSADWNCYRYKLFQTSVPLRNMIWRP